MKSDEIESEYVFLRRHRIAFAIALVRCALSSSFSANAILPVKEDGSCDAHGSQITMTKIYVQCINFDSDPVKIACFHGSCFAPSLSLSRSLARSLAIQNVNIVIRCTCQNITAAHTSRNSIHLDNRFLLIVAQICRHPLVVVSMFCYFCRWSCFVFFFRVLSISRRVTTTSLHIHRRYKFK